MEQYARYFPAGIKIGVGIPLPNAEVFRDWAIIHEIDEDLVSLQLSRDALPVNVSLNYGQILELRGGSDNNGYCCRAIIVSEGDAHELLLRLIGEIVSDELREFYRIDAFLPIKYFVSQEQHIDVLHKQWEERCEHRQQFEMRQKEKRWRSGLVSVAGGLPQERLQDHEEDDVDEGEPKESWDTIIPLAANVSGGGVRLFTHQGFEDGEYVLVEILIPSPQRVVDAIARVVFANACLVSEGDRPYFNTGFQFVYINERDRDAIVNYISNVQLKRIQQLRERYLFRDYVDTADSIKNTDIFSVRNIVYWIVSTLIMIVIVSVLINFFWHYANERPKGEIERVFEDGVKKYREKHNY
jgi:hypothetical protein